MAKKRRGTGDASKLWDILPGGLREAALGALQPDELEGPTQTGQPLVKGGFKERIKGGLRRNPGSFAVGAGLGLIQLVDLLKGPVGDAADAFGMNPTRSKDRAAQFGAAQELDRVSMVQEMRQQELQQLTQENMARIMTMAPEMGNQLLAGRRMGKGVRMIGGTPRYDLLAHVARQMAGGQFSSPPVQTGPVGQGVEGAI